MWHFFYYYYYFTAAIYTLIKSRKRISAFVCCYIDFRVYPVKVKASRNRVYMCGIETCETISISISSGTNAITNQTAWLGVGTSSLPRYWQFKVQFPLPISFSLQLDSTFCSHPSLCFDLNPITGYLLVRTYSEVFK